MRDARAGRGKRLAERPDRAERDETGVSAVMAQWMWVGWREVAEDVRSAGGGSAGSSHRQQVYVHLPAPLFATAAFQEECDEQYRCDLIGCKFMGLRSCHAQAMIRLAARERGKPIPPLDF